MEGVEVNSVIRSIFIASGFAFLLCCCCDVRVGSGDNRVLYFKVYVKVRFTRFALFQCPALKALNCPVLSRFVPFCPKLGYFATPQNTL